MAEKKIKKKDGATKQKKRNYCNERTITQKKKKRQKNKTKNEKQTKLNQRKRGNAPNLGLNHARCDAKQLRLFRLQQRSIVRAV